MDLEYVKANRGLDFIKKGMKVEHSYGGKTKVGKIVGGNSSGNLQIMFDGEKKSQNCHPRWAIKYFNNKGDVIAEFSE